MNIWHPLHPEINLHVSERISERDARRQAETAKAILERLAAQPGLVLADEVGMGKTFVALAVAASVALDDGKRPVVVMVPSSLREKWPNDFKVFSEACLPDDLRGRIRCASADTGVGLLKLLDDPAERRASIIFLTHGAMSRSLNDGWVKLAIVHRALHRRKDRVLRRAVEQHAASLVGLGTVIGRRDELCPHLLSVHPQTWLEVLRKHDLEPADHDDPVPKIVQDALARFDAGPVYQALEATMPRRYSANIDQRLREARGALRTALNELWRDSLSTLRFRLPLLILDEAHHLKNPGTRLASLFHAPDAADDAATLTEKGPLGGVFERMLFLTATPFQLGHSELCSVLERFDGIAWNSRKAPAMSRVDYKACIAKLRGLLDEAQAAALALDAVWSRLREEDLQTADGKTSPVEEWWGLLESDPGRSPGSDLVLGAFQRTYTKMRAAEEALRPWVIRHLKPRQLPEPYAPAPRRVRLAGAAIASDTGDEDTDGLPVAAEAALPFLLAARATVGNPEARPVFAEGLASSYESFLHTRRRPTQALDHDSEPSAADVGDGEVTRWYLDQLEKALPMNQPEASASHPKIAATARRVLETWRSGEKILVFCHFVQTGRTLRRVISTKLREAIHSEAALRLGCTLAEAPHELDRLGERFFDPESPARKAAEELTRRMLRDRHSLTPWEEDLVDAVRRYLRTPSFLVRYFPIGKGAIDAEAVHTAFRQPDGSGLSLERLLDGFFDHLDRRCKPHERKALLGAIERMKTGDIKSMSREDLQGEDEKAILPNVRLVNGSTDQDTRQRLMQAFNTPFFPEVLVASSVMAEGVDLHKFCRFVIHHDLDWNPSALEQRTGRVDRIGAKAEHCGKPIRVYLPYLAGTQDEKQFRVVMDRERWFSVVMGEDFKVGALQAERTAQRIPLPLAAAEALAFRLEVAVPPRFAPTVDQTSPGHS